MSAPPRPGAAPGTAGPKSHLKPLLAALVVVIVGAGVFLLVRGGGDDTGTEAAVKGTTVTRPARQATTTVPANATPTEPSTASSAVSTSLPPPTAPALTPTQQRELCHVAIAGRVEGSADTGDPLETCTTEDFVAVSVEVGVYLRADPNTDYRAILVQQCQAARAVGRNPLACAGIPTS
jgi:hypothetical protein